MKGWESLKIGAGPIPIETSEGWLVFYHGVLQSCNGYVYSFSAAILDIDKPWKVKYRCAEYLLNPREYYECVCLIAKSEPLDADKEALVEKLLVRMQGVSRARECKYIMLHAPKAKLAEVTALLPGAEHPTILPLAGSDDHVALHMVSSESLFWETMEELKALDRKSVV